MKKLSQLLPEPLRSPAQRIGLERWRVKYAARELMLNIRLRLGGAIQHVDGPESIELDDDELVVLCMVRNGAPWLPTYLRYYGQLGAKRIVILDNGSTDETVAIATERENVTVLTTPLPFGKYYVVLNRWLVKQFGRGGWSLMSDVDELFDYPYSSRLELSSFLQYLNHRKYTAVTAQNLEMLSAEPLAALQGRDEEDLISAYPFFDLSDITRTKNKYWIWMNETDTDALYSHSGGPRERVFGWSGSMLTKQPLIRSGSGVTIFPYDNHFVTGARLADVSGVFRHYKFINHFYEQVREEMRREQHFNDAKIFKQYAKVLRDNPDLRLTGSNARRYSRAEELLESGFLIASEEYRQWMRKHGSPPSSDSEQR